MPPHPSDSENVRHVDDGGAGSQQLLMWQTCPPSHGVATGVQTPAWHSFVTTEPSSQRGTLGQLPHEPPQPSGPQGLLGAHCGTQTQFPF